MSEAMLKHDSVLPVAGLQQDGSMARSVEFALECASKLGASDAVANIVCRRGYELTVRKGELETIEHLDSNGLSVVVYVDQKKGASSTSDLSQPAIEDAVRAAVTIAKFTAADPCNGLPPKDRLIKEVDNLELNFPWTINRERALGMALECEDAALSSDKRIVNSEGATLATSLSKTIIGNTDGLQVTKEKSSHSLSCAIVGQSKSGMQTDYWYTSARDPQMLLSPAVVGNRASERALRKLDARRINTCSVPVVFEAPIATSLLSCLISAISGGALYRKASFLLDNLGQQIFPSSVRIYQQPHLKRGLGSAVCDAEGVATQEIEFVRDGVLQSYVLDSYSARKLKLETTGNAGGVFNLTIDTGKRDLKQLLKLMDRGLLVTQTMGMGINMVTGDYSQGASGLWVENGEIQYPVEELTIASNLREMFSNVIEVGADIEPGSPIQTGSILLSNMTVAGK